MAVINIEKLIPELDIYSQYLTDKANSDSKRPFCNVEEEYKRTIAEKAFNILSADSWTSADIGTGSIGASAIKAVQNNDNLVGRYQVTGFSDKVKENTAQAERILFDLYHDHKEQECFEQICRLFGRKYDLLAFLYFIIDPNRYLPIRSSIFDSVFKDLGIGLKTNSRCSWDNYQEFVSTVIKVRDAMREYCDQQNVDILDAHSFLWTLSVPAYKNYKKGITANVIEVGLSKQKVEIGATVVHKDYGKGKIYQQSEENIYVNFDEKRRIFPYPKAFEKEYLKSE